MILIWCFKCYVKDISGVMLRSITNISQKVGLKYHAKKIEAALMGKKNEENGDIMLVDIKLYCKVTVMKIVRYWIKKENQWNRRVRPELNSHISQ